MEVALGRECEDLQKNVQRIQNEEYETLHGKCREQVIELATDIVYSRNRQQS
jgi:hypothetical protein